MRLIQPGEAMAHSMNVGRNWLAIPVLVAVVGLGVLSAFTSVIVGVFVSIVLLGTVALLPRANPLVYWPIGFFLAISLGYLSYLIHWSVGGQSLDHQFARMHFLVVIVCFGLIAMIRSWRHGRDQRLTTFNVDGLASVVLCIALPVVLIWIGSSRLSSDSISLFSGYMSGGDHGLHNQIIHNLLPWSATPRAENPYTLYTYPQGLHYLVALFTSLNSANSRYSGLVQEYLTGAWFEYLQLAAYVQLAAAIFVYWSRRARLWRAVFLAPLFLAFAAVDHFVAHLFWSGFMTSTGITWALLVPVAVWVARRGQHEASSATVLENIFMWIVMLLFSWIVYQPYVIVIAVSGLCMLLASLSPARSGWRAAILDHLRRHTPLIGFCAVTAATVLACLMLGRDSAAVSFLFLDGSTWRASLPTVLVWSAAATVMPLLAREHPQRTFPATAVSSLVGFTIGMAGVVFVGGDDGLLELPYYIQKMYWTVFYVSVPIALAAGFMLLWRSRYLSSIESRAGRLAGLWLVIALVPLVQGRTPNASVTHFSVDWFARGVFAVPTNDTLAVGAFSMRDKLGSHMANLALRSASTVTLSPDIAISGNPYLACSLLRDQGVNRIYTTPNGRAELVESGCSADASYVEDGTLMVSSQINYFSVSTDVTETFTNTSQGFRLLLRGFLPPEKWGTWAGGYRSALGFSYEEDLNNPLVQLTLRSHPKDEELRRVNIGVNGRIVTSRLLALGKPEPFPVSLPAGKKGTRIELTITCERSHEEVLADDPVDGPTACAGLESMRLEEKAD